MPPAMRTARWRRSIRSWPWKRAGTELVDVAIARAAQRLEGGAAFASRAPERAHDHFAVIVRVVKVAADLL